MLCCSKMSGCQQKQVITPAQNFRFISLGGKSTLHCLLWHEGPQHGAAFLCCWKWVKGQILTLAEQTHWSGLSLKSVVFAGGCTCLCWVQMYFFLFTLEKRTALGSKHKPVPHMSNPSWAEFAWNPCSPVSSANLSQNQTTRGRLEEIPTSWNNSCFGPCFFGIS